MQNIQTNLYYKTNIHVQVRLWLRYLKIGCGYNVSCPNAWILQLKWSTRIFGNRRSTSIVNISRNKYTTTLSVDLTYAEFGEI